MVSSAFPNPDDPIQKEWHELAKLTGYKPNENELSSSATAVANPESSHSDERTLLDEDDLEDDDEETKTPLHQNPFAKLLLASALVGSGVGALGLFLMTVNGQVQQATTTAHNGQTAPEATAETQDSEIGRLKTINGLGTQAQLLNQANQPTVTRRPGETPGTSSTRPTRAAARPPQQRTATPAPTPMPLPARPIPTAPATLPVVRSAPSRIAPAAAASTPAIDPAQQWETAKNLGSYGTGATAVLSSAIANTSTASPPMNPSLPFAPASTNSMPIASPIPTIAPPETLTSASVQVAQPVSASSDLQYQSDVQALMTGVRQSVAEIAPGATAVGTLRTPIAWAEDLDPSQQPQRISIELAQDIPSTDGSPAIPAGSQLIARITAISENGMMQIEAQQAIVQTTSGTQTFNLPPGAVLIAGQGGNPLVAESRKPGARDSLGDDLEVAAMGALGQVGGLLNRPSNESTMTSPYLSSTNVTNGSTNIVGGILEGGFNALMQSTQQRQQQRQQEMQQRPNLWLVPAGQTVQVFVNAPVQMAIGQGV